MNTVICAVVLALPSLVSQPSPEGAPSGASLRITQADLLRRVIDVQRLAAPVPAGERTRMFSSYDRRSRRDDRGRYLEWDANDDFGQFIRADADGWNVMAEIDGPGAITRMWCAEPQGQVRIVLDGQIVIETTMRSLFSGEFAPLTQPFVYGGASCCYPIGFARECRVLCRELQSAYQINVVEFPPGTDVERFTLNPDDATQAALAAVRQALAEGLSDATLFGGRRLMPVAVQQAIGPGEKLEERVDGSGTVRAFYVALTDKIDPRERYALHRCHLRVFIGKAQEPCIDAPLCDFFGSGFDLVPFNSLVMGTNREVAVPLPERPFAKDRYMYCFFPMPFREGLRVEITNHNEGRQKIGLILYMRVDTQPPAPDALRFFARYRRVDPCDVFENVLLKTEARGRIVGWLLNVDCPREAWWGEGDEKVWIDSETFPSYFGTGTAEFLGSRMPLAPHVTPLQGVTRTWPYGKNSGFRWLVGDAINFQHSVWLTLENWPSNGPRDTYYGTLVYWYADHADVSHFAALTSADLSPPGLRIPGAIEIETHIVGSEWGTVIHERHAGAELSGRYAANVTTSQPVRIAVPATAEREVLLQLRVSPSRPFGTITVRTEDGQLVGTAEFARGTDGFYDVGRVRLQRGSNFMSVTCDLPAMLDCWIVAPLPDAGAEQSEP